MSDATNHPAWGDREDADAGAEPLVDDGRLLCALCGTPLFAAECILRVSYEHRQRMGWHLDCYDKDTVPYEYIPWTDRVATVEARGPHRIGEVE